jgi:dUTP pyrophosphatase
MKSSELLTSYLENDSVLLNVEDYMKAWQADMLKLQNSRLELLVQKLDKKARLPTKAHSNDAGYDLYSLSEIILKPGRVTDISTGIALAIPDGYVGLIWDRSSMGAKAVKVLGGVIDAGYRGEIKLKLIALNTFEQEWITLQAGSKVAQILIQRVENLPLIEVENLPESQRGEKGFGSSGV